MSVDIIFRDNGWDQCWNMVRYSFTSTETRKLVRKDSPGRPPRLSLTQLLNYVMQRTDHSLSLLNVNGHPRTLSSTSSSSCRLPLSHLHRLCREDDSAVPTHSWHVAYRSVITSLAWLWSGAAVPVDCMDTRLTYSQWLQLHCPAAYTERSSHGLPALAKVIW